MNSDDINLIQGRINLFDINKAHPDIILEQKKEISMKNLSAEMEVSSCLVISIMNELRGRPIRYPEMSIDGKEITIKRGVLSEKFVVASLASSMKDLYDLFEDLEYNPKKREETMKLFRLLQDKENDIIVSGISGDKIHEFIKNSFHQLTVKHSIFSADSLKAAYTILRGMFSLSGKVLDQRAIIGGFVYAYQGDTESFEEMLSQALSISKVRISEAMEWYRTRLDIRPLTENPTGLQFYRESLTKLLSLEGHELPGFVTYELKLESEVIYIQSHSGSNLVDIVSNLRASPEMPFAITTINGRKVSKIHNTPVSIQEIKPNWIPKENKEMKENTIRFIIRESKRPKRHKIISYNVSKNQFKINRTDKYLSLSRIMTILCESTGTFGLGLPRVTTQTYSFITNYIASETQPKRSGLDHNILAWVITNPPKEYADTGFQDYVFVKEDAKPNSQRTLISIHMQIGDKKIYLTFSKKVTTSGTLTHKDKNVPVGFADKSQYLLVTVNKAPNIHYARLARSIYEKIIQLYFKYYNDIRKNLNFFLIGSKSSMIDLKPYLIPLRESMPSLTKQFIAQDPLLYRYTSSMTISDENLPIPIPRSDVEDMKRKGYPIMKLPTIIVNNPKMKIHSSGEICLTTSKPGSTFSLIRKSNEPYSYFPIMKDGRKSDLNMKEITINKDMTISTRLEYIEEKASHVLDETKTLFDRPGRYALLSSAMKGFLSRLWTSNIPHGEFLRLGISIDVLPSMNHITKMMPRKTPEDLVQYAYLCRQECWEQNVHEIEADILMHDISFLRHFRALEELFQINIYFISDDKLSGKFRIPPHSFFYASRVPRFEKTILLHSFENQSYDPDLMSFSIITFSPGYNTKEIFFPNTKAIDDEFNLQNITVYGIDEKEPLRKNIDIPNEIGNWSLIEQIVDSNGKTRGVTYQKNTSYASITIGFSPILDIPIGPVREPTRVNGNIEFVIDNGDIYNNIIIFPSGNSPMDRWIIFERVSRLLRVLSHVIASMYLYYDEWEPNKFLSEMFHIDPQVKYTRDTLQCELPQFDLQQDNQEKAKMAMKFLSPKSGGLIQEVTDGKYKFVVSSAKVKKTIYQHLMSLEPILWPKEIPHYMLYSTDVVVEPDELVFMDLYRLVDYISTLRYPSASNIFINSISPYILTRGDYKYLVQMTRSEKHAMYVASEWKYRKYNPGYYGEGEGQYQISENTVPEIFTERLLNISFTFNSSRNIFVIIPI